MSKGFFLWGVYLLLFKLVISSKDESVINTCQIDQISERLRKNSFNSVSLTFVCNNSIDLSLNSGIFTSNMTLQSLTFRGFNLEILPNAFQNLFNLQYLRFHNCHFLYIHKEAFGGPTQLHELDLSSNNITVFSSLWIPRSSHIDILNLSQNNITHFSEQSYTLLRASVSTINLEQNDLKCHCANKWLYLNNHNVIVDKRQCNISLTCIEEMYVQPIEKVIAVSFRDVVVHCPIKVNSSLITHSYWISPHDDVFTNDRGVFHGQRASVRVAIQPMILDTTVTVNDTSLSISYFRGYFAGQWSCVGVSQSGYSVSGVVVIDGRVRLRAIFDFSVMVGFSFAGCWLLLAIIVGLVQYLRETSCCRHRIDYNQSSLYAKTVIPVPVDSGDDNDTSGDGSSGDMRAGHNDVELIFTDENLADQYVQMLTDLKDASQVADENFYNRLRDMRARFSVDFSRMRVDIKRGMQSLRSNSTAAAHKLRRGVVHMKDHMRSFTEFCGSSTIAQSISIVVISDNSNNSANNNNVNIEERPRKHTVFNFFEPC